MFFSQEHVSGQSGLAEHLELYLKEGSHKTEGRV